MSRDDTFAADWLAMREPFDHDARAGGLAEALGRALPGERRVRLLDLGGGTGSNFRFMAPRLMGTQDWVVLDHDPLLIERIGAVTLAWAQEVGFPSSQHDEEVAVQGWRLTWRQRKLGTPAELLAVLDEAAADGVDAVVTSALLDLVGEPWLRALADWCAGQRVPLLAALTVDGRLSCDPMDPRDASVFGWFQEHQRADHGLGPQPGPDAAERLAAALEARGYRVRLARADWRLPSDEPEMLAQMIDGVAAAAAEMSPTPAAVEAWRLARRAEMDAGHLSMTVGHLDLLALP